MLGIYNCTMFFYDIIGVNKLIAFQSLNCKYKFGLYPQIPMTGKEVKSFKFVAF